MLLHADLYGAFPKGVSVVNLLMLCWFWECPDFCAYIYIYIYIYACMRLYICVYMCVWLRERKREREKWWSSFFLPTFFLLSASTGNSIKEDSSRKGNLSRDSQSLCKLHRNSVTFCYDHCFRRRSLRTGYRRYKWTRRPEFKSGTRLFVFHIAISSLRNAWIPPFSLQPWVNRRAFSLALEKVWEKETVKSKPAVLRLKSILMRIPTCGGGVEQIHILKSLNWNIMIT